MSKYSFIFNPRAGKGIALRLRERLYKAVKAQTSDFEFVQTEAPSDATKLARRSSSTIVVAIGGDGTVQEVANGILGTEKVLGIIPAGSGNDFIKSVRVPRRLDQAVECLFQENVAQVDIGRVEWYKYNQTIRGNPSSSFFVNGLGIGFDAAVADRTRRISFASGTLLYFIAVLQTLGRYKSPEFTTSVDGRENKSRNLLIAVGNGICAGGGFYLTPDAKVDDSLLDLCLIEDMSVPRILGLMPQVMKGKHRDNKAVTFDRGKQIKVSANGPFAVHADGEIIGNDVAELKIEVIPKALNVIVGRVS